MRHFLRLRLSVLRLASGVLEAAGARSLVPGAGFAH
jgi:hypothetical protein